MDEDEREICAFLKTCPRDEFFSVKQISRQAGGKARFREDPNWALPVIQRLLESKVVETDGCNHYRLLQRQSRAPVKWISPRIRKALEQSGKTFEILEDPEEDTGINPL